MIFSFPKLQRMIWLKRREIAFLINLRINCSGIWWTSRMIVQNESKWTFSDSDVWKVGCLVFSKILLPILKNHQMIEEIYWVSRICLQKKVVMYKKLRIIFSTTYDNCWEEIFLKKGMISITHQKENQISCCLQKEYLLWMYCLFKIFRHDVKSKLLCCQSNTN